MAKRAPNLTVICYIKIEENHFTQQKLNINKKELRKSRT